MPVNEEKDAGTYKVAFDGSQLPGGIYMMRENNLLYHLPFSLFLHLTAHAG